MSMLNEIPLDDRVRQNPSCELVNAVLVGNRSGWDNNTPTHCCGWADLIRSFIHWMLFSGNISGENSQILSIVNVLPLILSNGATETFCWDEHGRWVWEVHCRTLLQEYTHGPETLIYIEGSELEQLYCSLSSLLLW